MAERLVSMLIVGGEVLLVVSVLLGVLVYRVRTRWRKDRMLARQFVDKLKANEGVHLETIRKVLKETYHLDEAALEENATTLFALERSLYSRVLRIFLGQEREALETLDETVESLVRGYRDLVPGPADAPPSEGGSDKGAPLREENEALRNEKERLEAELAEARETMETMVKEYVSMYGGSHEEAMRKLGRSLKKAES